MKKHPNHRTLIALRMSADSVICLRADLLQITVWLTEAGTVDEGGKTQPAYLNFDVALLGPPAGNQMEVRALLYFVQGPHPH